MTPQPRTEQGEARADRHTPRFYVRAVREEDALLGAVPGRWTVELEGWERPPAAGEFLRCDLIDLRPPDHNKQHEREEKQMSDELKSITVTGPVWVGPDEDGKTWAGSAEVDYPDTGEVGLHVKARVDGELDEYGRESPVASLYLSPLAARALAVQLLAQAERSDVDVSGVETTA